MADRSASPGMDWRFVEWSDRCDTALRDLLALAAQKETISFAGGVPIVSEIDRGAVLTATEDALSEAGDRIFQYGATVGVPELRDFLAERMTARGAPATAENILIVSGAQQALDLVARLFLAPGGRIACRFPTYPGCLAAWHPLEPDYVDRDALRASGAEGIAFAYALPNFENPTGRRWPYAERAALLADARAAGVPILEDDPYRELRFDEIEEPSLIALDAEGRSAPYDGSVIYLGSISKTLAPGLRVGWVCAAPEVIERLTLIKQGADLHTPNLTQHIVLRLAANGVEDRNAAAVRGIYKSRCAEMTDSLRRQLTNEISFSAPDGGMFLWATLDEAADANALLDRALKHGVGFVPGTACYPPATGGKNQLRLNFTANDRDATETGVERLAAALRETGG
ncbi:MAG: PLP-dependent aminotransferase family protein [Pseudomonadota bacterium]